MSTTHSSRTDRSIGLDCRECGFTRRIDETSHESPADVIVDHGRETGHKISIEVES